MTLLYLAVGLTMTGTGLEFDTYRFGRRVIYMLVLTPQAYQPVYRDPVGRTIMVELRKVF